MAIKKIIFNADDFGYDKDVNKGIVYAHKNGVVKSTTVLTGREAFDDAVWLAKENPGLKTGLHIDLDEFVEIQRPQGTILKYKNFPPSKQQITDTINRQLDKFLTAGLKLSHLDSHHHTHLLPEVLPAVIEKAKELNVPMRFYGAFYTDVKFAEKMLKMVDDAGVKHPGHFINGWYWQNIDEDFETAELMTHPGFKGIWREYEMAKCCDPNLIEYLNAKGIEIISFEEL